MTVVLARIDDRLIHGQVTVGWSQKLRPDRIVLANDAIADDSWQSRVYSSSVPPDIAVSILSMAQAADLLSVDHETVAERILLLTADPSHMAELVRLGARLSRINLGGLHFSNGRLEMLPYVYVSQADLAALRWLVDLGVSLTAQQVPGGREHQIGPQQILEMEARF